jgi:hypothetical protein
MSINKICPVFPTGSTVTFPKPKALETITDGLRRVKNQPATDTFTKRHTSVVRHK